MFEMGVELLFGLLLRKKLLFNLPYLLGTVAFVFFSYRTSTEVIVISVNTTNVSRSSPRTPCDNHHDPSRSSLSSLIAHSNMLDHLGFVLRPQSFFYCSVPKVATRTVLTFLTYLHIRDELIPAINSTRYSSTALSQILPPSNGNASVLSSFLSYLLDRNETTDLWSIYQKQALPLLRLRSLSDPSLLFSNAFTRAILVRHPLERLVSAYTDKIASLKSPSSSIYNHLRRSICEQFSSSYVTPTESCATKIPSFAHFVEHIMVDSSQNDVHWYPYSSLCHVCLMKYNFVGKYETIDADLHSLISRLGLNASQWNRQNPYSSRRKKTHDHSLYAPLSNRAYCFLKAFYREDFRLFDYRLEDYFPDRSSINCSSERFRSFLKLI